MNVLVRESAVVPSWAVLLAVFAFPALEASTLFGLLVPGEIAVLLGGVAAHDGRVPLSAVMAAAVLGAVVGDTVGYGLGARFGPRVLSRAPRRAAPHVEQARAFVRRYGGAAVLLGRWTAYLRALVPSVAGVSGVPYRRFAAYNVAGGIIWGVTVAAVGFVTGAAFGGAQRSLGVAGAVVAVVLLLLVITLSSKAHEAGGTNARRSSR